MSPVEFAGAFTWAITFRERDPDSSDMTLLTFNSAQHNKCNMMHNISKIFFVVTCCNNNSSAWFLIYFPTEQSSLWTSNPTTLYKRSARSRDDTKYSNLSWEERCFSTLWPDAVSSNWRFINRNAGVLFWSRTINFLIIKWPIFFGGLNYKMEITMTSVQVLTYKILLTKVALNTFYLNLSFERTRPANCIFELCMRTCSPWSEAQNNS